MSKVKSLLSLFAIPLVFLTLANIFFSFDGLYGQDAYEYLRYSKALRDFMLLGENPEDYFWSLFYPLFGAIGSIITYNTALILQIISALSLSISTLYLYKILLIIYAKNNTTSLFIVLFFILSPTVFTLGLIVMSDMLATCFIILCCYHTLQYSKEQLVKSFYLALLFGMSAVMTRYASFVVLAPFAIYLLFFLFKKKKHLLHLVGLLMLFALLVFPHFYFRNGNPFQFLNHNALTKWSVINFFKSTFITDQGISGFRFPNILYAFYNVFHPRYLVLGFIFILCLIYKKTLLKAPIVFLVSVLLYALFLAGIDTQNPRFLVLSFPLVLVVFFPSFNFLFKKITSNKIKFGLIGLIAISQIWLCAKGIKPIVERNLLEKSIAQEMKKYQNNILYSFDMDISLQGRGLNFKYQNLWTKKYTIFEKGALVLFHPTKFNTQWKDKYPITNWQRLNNEYNLMLLENFSEGWKLYKIETK